MILLTYEPELIWTVRAPVLSTVSFCMLPLLLPHLQTTFLFSRRREQQASRLFGRVRGMQNIYQNLIIGRRVLIRNSCSRVTATMESKVPGTDNGNPFSTNMKGTLDLCTKDSSSCRKTRVIRAAKGWLWYFAKTFVVSEACGKRSRRAWRKLGWRVNAALSLWRTSWRKWSDTRYTGTLGICVRKSLYSRSICLTAAKASDQSQPRKRQTMAPSLHREILWGRSYGI